MAPTYFRREPGIDALQRPSRLRTFSPSVRSITNSSRRCADAKAAFAPGSARRAAMRCRRTCVPPRPRRSRRGRFRSPLGGGAIVSGFMPLKSEINPAAADAQARGRGRAARAAGDRRRGKPLTMRAYAFGEPLASGVWGIREPKPDAREVDPDILLVPLLAFDRARPSPRLRRRLLRPDDHCAARAQADHRRRHRLRRAGSSRGADDRRATPASISC